MRAELSAPFGRAGGDLAEIQVCPGRLFCPRLSQPARSRNGSTARKEHARWKGLRPKGSTAVVRKRSPNINCPVEGHLHFRDYQQDDETSRRFGRLSGKLERAVRFHKYNQ